MRKSIIGHVLGSTAPVVEEEWLDLAQLASVEVTSEAPDHPAESVFTFGKGPGWSANEGGAQTIRVIFDEPQRVRRIWLRFVETEKERTQEFTLQWSGNHACSMREIVRQQWTFSPENSPVEDEDFRVDLAGASILELTIKPDISSNRAVATLAEWRLA